MIFNQFEEFGNYLWHYEITGHAMEEVIKKELRKGGRFGGVALTTGSAEPFLRRLLETGFPDQPDYCQ
jgi:hypothetical protein